NNFTVYMVDARKTLHLRNMMNLNTIKSDSEDAHVLAATPWHDPRYMEYTGHNRSSLSNISRERNIVVKSITAIKNYIYSDLAAIFPEFINLYDIDSSTGMAILYEYATPYNIVNAGIDNVIKIVKKASKGHYNMEDINKLMEISENSIGIPDEDGAYKFKIRMNINRLKNEMNNLKDIEKEIINKSNNNEDVKNISNLKGIGIINSAIIVSEIGNIEQFKSPLKLESYAGKCPDIESSGGKTHTKGITHVRNKYLSNAVYESAISLVMNKNKEFYDIFNREIGKKKSNVQAYIAVSKRLLFHIYSIMKNH
ncbi:transposase, partial [Acidiplasma aeolicum]|uniref:transposase n=1 Tax=Acidiplasma aeolicum TaxID=507754 RepID=UPI000A02DD1B